MTAEELYLQCMAIESMHGLYLRTLRALSEAESLLALSLTQPRVERVERRREDLDRAREALRQRAGQVLQDPTIDEAITWAEYVEALSQQWEAMRRSMAEVDAACTLATAFGNQANVPSRQQQADALSTLRDNFVIVERKLRETLGC